MTAFQVAAMRHADNHDYHDDDSMPRAERHAWVAAIEYARSMGEDNNAAKVDFAIFCQGRTDLDDAWAEWQ
jgi:hypothetical protein